MSSRRRAEEENSYTPVPMPVPVPVSALPRLIPPAREWAQSDAVRVVVRRLEQRNEAMASVLDENEAGLLRLRVQHSDVAEFNATFSRSMDAVQAAQRSVRSGDPQVLMLPASPRSNAWTCHIY